MAKKTSRSCQNYPLRVQTNNFWIEILFKSFEQFWIFCRNLWHGSQTSIFVSRVKIAEEMVFFVFLFRIFLDIWAKIFQTFGQKTSRSWQNYPLRVQTNNFWLEIFFKILSRFAFSSENLAWFSNFYLRVHRKNSGRNNFFILLFRFFSEFERNFFSDFWPKNFKKLSKLTSVCADEQFLAWKFFQKFWTVLDFLQKPLAWFSNFCLGVQSKNSGRNNFFILLFRVFFGFWAKIFSEFWPKNFKKFSKLPSKCPEEQFVAWIFF